LHENPRSKFIGCAQLVQQITGMGQGIGNLEVFGVLRCIFVFLHIFILKSLFQFLNKDIFYGEKI